MRNLDSESTGICTPVQCLYDSDCPDVGDTCSSPGGMKGKFCTLGVPGLISFMAYLYTHKSAKKTKKSILQINLLS